MHSLKAGGRFCGYLSGDRDYWATDPNFNYLTPDQIEQLFEPFDLEVFDEEEHLGRNVLGEEKYWHLYNIVARKRG
ncbi:hypothetical protein [Acaryochloris sp. IP29b_bin.137]|uniref:hypothetical protein n=1 Tax=Acaryochloris sp. IP29b_bin.137 TaxID=2969217 RepID=UPI002607C748|nr:hypothetical protein [Acaryochloris sp. IP29b_bin.137]